MSVRLPASPLGLAIALALSSAAVPALAQDATNLDTVIVTGTRAADRTVLESTSPVDVLTAEDIRKAGVVNGELGSALQALLPSFNFPRQSNSGGADHVRAAQLRGLSPDQVLVLVNGKRRHHTALVNTDSKIGKGTTPVDFNSIPVSAIKRIEVLRDGAGALYGSDAVAGVINVILDNGGDGGEIEASYGANHTDLKPIGRTLTDGQTGNISAKVGTSLGEDGAFLRVGLEYKHRNGTNRAGFDQIPPWDQTPDNLALQGKRNYVLGDGKSKDINLWLNTEIPVGQTSTFYAFGTFNQRDTEGANYFRYPDGDANWKEVYPNGYRPISEGENRDVQAVAGVRGQWGEWSYDGSLDYGQNDFTYRLRDSLNASLGPTSPTRFKTADYEYAQTVGNLDLSRVFTQSESISHTLGLGVEARHERYQTRPGDPASYAAGPFTDRPTGSQAGGGLTPQDTATLSRDVASAYASLSSQFGEKFSTDLAARYEHNDDFGGELTGKLGLRYEFTPAFALRGAISNNFRAPSLAQIGYESTSTGYNAGGQLVQGRLLSVNNPIARGLGAQNLKPEKSLNTSLGFTSRIGEHFDLSLDFFQIDIDDRIALSESITGDALTDYVAANYGVSGLQSASFFVNAADTRTRGAELVSNWRQSLGDGQLLLTGTYAYTKTTLKNVLATPAQLQALNPNYVLFGIEETNTLTDATPRTRGSFSAAWSNDHWSLSTRVNRYGSATRVFNFGDGYIPRQTYQAEWQLDAEVEYRITPRWSVAIGGQNLTDNYPDRSNSDIHYFGNLPYDVLSPIGSNGAYYYGRVRYTF
ncbi:TPA: TonB-dependent receptor [Stenotrophomonas maltophilia]|uniref:TonB-dependent receptor plug domain-containing protein n=1 Tax=Stenotrophomonas TaxID=40323 RepID=UPI0013DB8EA7|nr:MULTISPECIES: TonB-dependent receptor [Stenotrophomonas]MBH1604527.1 TonB-dependent receptor [Stenotrophomonas maltophilia]MDQ7291953.1 TonB-dependent receptor [Stenotrophomonas sp. Sm2128]MDT3473959.1 TonB-dependent receptor [Stenotrophomonas maltophilia]HDS1833669.1 TonB-dependent receptor [Stenotrophomonas maltophilia]HDX0787972.1 TonB-dependent receptor [Stenotrophomonas maltophilia]